MFSGPNAGACPAITTTPKAGIFFGHDVICWHGTLSGDGAEPGLHSEQLVLVLVEFVLQLGAPQDEHAAKLGHRDPVKQPPDLGQGEPEFLQGHDPVELGQLRCRVASVPGIRVDRRRGQQPDLVIVPNRADRYAPEPSELADAEHDTIMQPSPSGRVKGILTRIQPGDRPVPGNRT